MEQTLANGWSRNILALQIDAQARALPKELQSALPTVEEKEVS